MSQITLIHFPGGQGSQNNPKVLIDGKLDVAFLGTAERTTFSDSLLPRLSASFLYCILEYRGHGRIQKNLYHLRLLTALNARTKNSSRHDRSVIIANLGWMLPLLVYTSTRCTMLRTHTLLVQRTSWTPLLSGSKPREECKKRCQGSAPQSSVKSLTHARSSMPKSSWVKEHCETHRTWIHQCCLSSQPNYQSSRWDETGWNQNKERNLRKHLKKKIAVPNEK